VTSPKNLPFALMALEKSASSAPSDDAVLRSAIVNVARHFLRMAERKTPAEMEAIIWRQASVDGADHGPSCAAFASLTLELGSHVAGHESWVTGGTSYPWPLHAWADARVGPNPASPNVLSVLQDAQNHHRWHPLGDGYDPQPGDWVLFDGHVEVVTNYGGGVLHTIGGDSLPNYSVNAHSYRGPLTGQGVAGFVDNGIQPAAAAASSGQAVAPGDQSAPARARAQATAQVGAKLAQPQRYPRSRTTPAGNAGQAANVVQGRKSGKADIPGTGLRQAPTAPRARPGQAEIPGLLQRAPRRATSPHQLAPYQRHQEAPAVQPAAPGSPLQRAFIEQVAPGAMATQRKYGVPASVTIAQAIDESAWGQSMLATQDHNLFGIKGTGPAGSDLLPTQEFAGGQLVDTTAPFRVYHDVGQSIEAHGKLLARSDYFTNAMANRRQPNAFAAALTGVYATDPGYGTKLIQLMQQYNLYRFNVAAAAHSTLAAAAGGAAIPGVNGYGSATQGRSTSASAAQPASGGAAAAQAGLTDGRVPTAQPERGRGQERSPHTAGTQGAGGHGAPARRGKRAGTADANPAPGSAIPGTGYPVPSPRQWRAAVHQAGTPGQADIPGLPGTAAAPTARGAHRAQDAPRVPHAEAQASGPRPGRAHPVGATPAQGSHQRSSPPAAAPPRGTPGWAVPGPAIPGRATPHGARASGHPGRGPIHQYAAPGPPPFPGVAGTGVAQPTAGQAAQATPGLGDALIPGVPPTASGPTATADGSGAVPQDGAPALQGGQPQDGRVPRQRTVPQDGARMPGLPSEGSETARHSPHRSVAARRGRIPTSAGHGTNLSPTRARRFTSVGQSAQGGHRTGPAGRGHLPAASPAAAPVSAQRPAPPAPLEPVSARRPAAAAVRGPSSAHRPATHPALEPVYVHRPAAAPVLEPVSVHRPTAAAAAEAATATASAPRSTGAIPGQPGGRPASGRGTAPAPPSPSSAPGPPPTWGGDFTGFAPAAPTAPQTPSPASGAGTIYGSGEPIPATTTAIAAVRYSHHLPPAVGKAYLNSAKMPLVRGEPLYVDVAGQNGVSWEILAACDWMQCKAKPGLSPVYGEKLGTVNPDGTSYRTRSAALERCAYDLVELARSVYQIDLTRGEPLSVRELANAFAAFRWGGLLKHHHTSAMEFPYSVAGLTTQHMHMRWPNIDDPQAPDRPGARFHQPFGAVPLVLSLSYPATA
jgi:flagellum-specific peptidoglycan hydrolase FlgJ